MANICKNQKHCHHDPICRPHKVNNMNQDIQNGSHSAEQLIPLIRILTDNADNKIHWWAGFLGGLAGCAGAELGHEVLEVLNEAFQDAVKQGLKNESH